MFFFSFSYDGRRWEELSQGNTAILNKEYNTGWLLNTDGVAVFKSAKCSVYPVYMMNMNLPNHMRKDIRYILWFNHFKFVF